MNQKKELAQPLMRNSKFLKIIQDILSLDDESMKVFSKEYSDELSNLRNIFTEASSQYNRWHEKLCFKLPVNLLDDYMASDDSTLILANYYKKNKYSVQNRINLRIKVQEDIYKTIPIIEKKKYGYLLEVNKNNDICNTPDIYLMDFFNHIETSFNKIYHNIEGELYENYGVVKLEFDQIIKLSEYTYETIKNNISTKLIKSQYKESLASKVLINSTINRCILEIDELAHLHCDAYEFVFDILSKIENYEFNINNEDDIFLEIQNILYKVDILEKSSELISTGLMIKINKCLNDLCELSSKDNPELYKDRKKINFTLEGKFLMGLTISLLEYKNYKINLKASGINHTKYYEIFNKNTKIEEKFHFSIQVLINRIYYLLYYSEQYKKISIKEFAKYNIAIIEKRNFLRKLMIEMKKNNLEQFSHFLKPIQNNNVS
ncbi:hypothetical protein [Acinetobacter indicus]|uniref:hypothetical protein n=1 Tax=Acinetobacter indicus TaxID=756892 RepID=UPI0012E30E65|nr:hypothetical protein [Acinetobacter indicus]